MNIAIKSTTDLIYAILISLAGIALFIFTIKILGNSLKNLAGPKFRKILLKISKNRFIAMLFGVAFTTLIQSSDGAMAIIMGLLAASLIDLKGAIAFLLGANIGTATTSLLVSFQSELKFTHWFFLLVFIGVFGYLLFKKEKWVQTFLSIFAIGLVFLSLTILGAGVKAIAAQEWFRNSVSGIGSSPWYSYLFSIGLTGTLQSSSATVAIYQKVYESSGLNSDGILPLASAIALVLGANVGTTFTGLIVSFTSGDKNSKKIALIWGWTNISISFIILLAINPFSWLIQEMNLIRMQDNSGKTQGKGYTLQLSIAHLLFNGLLVSIYIWLIKPIEWCASKIIRDKKVYDKHTVVLPPALLSSDPLLALAAARQSLANFGNLAYDALDAQHKFVEKKDLKYLEQYENYKATIEDSKDKLYVYLMKLSRKELSKQASQEHMTLIMASRSIETIANLGADINKELIKVYSKSRKEFRLDTAIIEEINQMILLNLKLLGESLKQVLDYKTERIEKIQNLSENVDAMSIINFETQVQRIKENVSANISEMEMGFDYPIVLRTFERIAHRSQRINKYMMASREENSLKINEVETTKDYYLEAEN